jgi:hypothetical protein
MWENERERGKKRKKGNQREGERVIASTYSIVDSKISISFLIS